MTTHPYIVKNDATGEQLVHVKTTDNKFNESWLQELLRLHPDILPTSEIETIFAPLIPIGREVGVSVGSIDNLFISQFGYLVLVETKLWRNPEARREVLAQAIDYGASLSKWKYEQIDQVTRSYTAKYEDGELSLMDWFEQRFGPGEEGSIDFENKVSKNLRLGRFLTLIVGDQIRKSLIEVLSHVNRHPQLSMDVGLVELACYRLKENSDWPLVVVPNLVARTEIIERSVVEVTLVGEENYKVEVSQVKAPAGETGKGRQFLTEETYWNLLGERSRESLAVAKQLIERYRKLESVIIEPSTSAIVARLDIQDSGARVTLFFIDTYGRLRTWPDTVRAQIIIAGIDGSLAGSFRIGMNQILNCAKSKCSKEITKTDLVSFNQVIDTFIQSVQNADRVD